MKATRTAALLFLSLLFISVWSGLPQPVKAQGTATLEGIWGIVYAAPFVKDYKVGDRFKIGRAHV